MTKKRLQGTLRDVAELRSLAEKRQAERGEPVRPWPDPPEQSWLAQELEIHQFELEIQNEELQRARDDLENLMTRYADLYDFAPVGYFAVARDGTILQVNSAGARMLEVPRTGLVGRRFADFVAPEARATVAGFLSKACDTLSPQRSDAPLFTATKHPLYVHIGAVASTSGQSCRVTIVDTTERYRAERALEASEGRYRRLFESSKDGLLLLNAASGVVIAVNPAICDWLRLPAEAFEGRALWEIEALRGIAASRSAFLEAQARGGLSSDHVGIAAADGPSVDVELSSHSYRVAGENLMQIRLCDIGERLRSEQAQRDMKEQRERVRTLEAIGRLAGGVAHELNNKLGVVIGSVDLLRTILPEGPERRRLDQIDQAASHAAALTHQLLAFARRQVLQPKIVAASPLVADMLQRLSPSLDANVQVVQALSAVGHIRVDPAQLQGLLMILMANAREAMPDGGRISLATEDVSLIHAVNQRGEVIHPGRYVLLTVSDTGKGLSADTMDRIFEPFNSTEPDEGNAALGLAAVYGTVKQSGGSLLVESAPGVGTTFRIYLPCTEGADVAAQGTKGAARRGIRTVLVLDDEASMLDIITEVLRVEGYDVVAAKDGEEAVRAAASRSFDLLLTDVLVPKLHGPVVAERLRERCPEMRVLYMSGHPHEELSARGLLDSSDGLIQKPFAVADLIRRVKGLE